MMVVQVNLNHCRDARNLLQQFVREENVSVPMVNDPYPVRSPGWCTEPSSGLASVGVLSAERTVGGLKTGIGFVATTVGRHLRVYSCCAPPRWTDNEFGGLPEQTGRPARGVGLLRFRGPSSAATSTPGRRSWASRVTFVDALEPGRRSTAEKNRTFDGHGQVIGSSTLRSPRGTPLPGCATGRLGPT